MRQGPFDQTLGGGPGGESVREKYLLGFPVTFTRPSFTLYVSFFMTRQDIYMLNYIFHQFLIKISLFITKAFSLTIKQLDALRQPEQLFSLSLWSLSRSTRLIQTCDRYCLHCVFAILSSYYGNTPRDHPLTHRTSVNWRCRWRKVVTLRQGE